MKKKIISLMVIALLMFFCYHIYNKIEIKNHQIALSNRLTNFSIDNSQYLSFNELIPFDWERVYFFGPYTSKDFISSKMDIIFFNYKPQYTEGTMQIYFVNKGRVVCFCNGDGIKNGYYIDGLSEFKEFNSFYKNDCKKVFCDMDLSGKFGYIYIKIEDN